MVKASGFAKAALPELRALVERVLPGGSLVEVTRLGTDTSSEEGTTKAVGYGEPLRLRARAADGRERLLVFHTAQPDIFGHDRRADRAAELLLAFDRFPSIPSHVEALDVGAIRTDGAGLVSLAETGEFYLLTSWAEGHPYADELRRIAHEKRLLPSDLDHCDLLAKRLAEIHAEKLDDPPSYIRALRDVVGSGEGIFGIVDGYPAGVPAAPRERLKAIEASAAEWRWRLRGREPRLSRIHGDYHPFNVVFDDAGELALLDAARGCLGDPADDVVCMAVNYVFFGVEAPGAWRGALRELWYRFFSTYLSETRDRQLFEVAAPFLAWRALVVCSPLWYPHVGGGERERVLRFIERVLAADALEPEMAEEIFA